MGRATTNCSSTTSTWRARVCAVHVLPLRAVPVAERQRDEYAPPLKDRGSSSIGFTAEATSRSGSATSTTAYERGHEIGTHALGHFCGAGGVADWGPDDWRSELTQFDTFLDNWRTNLGPELSADVPKLPFNSSVVQGIRTPCLQGNRDAMWPEWQEAGFTYDASNTGSLGWPKIDGFEIWEFPLQTIPVVGFDRGALAMDYNLVCIQNGCSSAPIRRRSSRSSSRRTTRTCRPRGRLQRRPGAAVLRQPLQHLGRRRLP